MSALAGGVERIPVAVLGATGVVGQRLIARLDRHPVFRLAEVGASPGRAGRRYGEEVAWRLGGDAPGGAATLELLAPDQLPRSPVVLSALPAHVAQVVEPRLSAAGRLVCTNASSHRLSPSAVLMVPDVNPEAVDAWVPKRSSGRPTGGPIVANPNCVVGGIAVALAPLLQFGVRAVTVVTLQAISGAGADGVAAYALAGNVIPWIAGEEEKIGPELGRILGCDVPVSVAVNRVPVLDGHTAHLFIDFEEPPTLEEVAEAIESYRPRPEVADLPSIPGAPLRLMREADRPQPRLDAPADDGMGVSVGRLRATPVHDVAMVVVAHNGERGAAGACLANAEWCAAQGLVPAPEG